MADPIQYTHNLTGRRRLIKTHLPLPFLPPGILTTCKVLLSHSHSSDWDAQRWSWWPGTWRTAQCLTSTTTSTSPLMTSSATSTPSPRCSSWASSTTAHIGGTWEALRGPKEFWDSGVHPWCFLHFQLIEELIHQYICWEVKIKRQVLLSFEIKLSDLRKWNKTKNLQYVKFVTSWGSNWQTKRCQTLRILSQPV